MAEDRDEVGSGAMLTRTIGEMTSIETAAPVKKIKKGVGEGRRNFRRQFDVMEMIIFD